MTGLIRSLARALRRGLEACLDLVFGAALAAIRATSALARSRAAARAGRATLSLARASLAAALLALVAFGAGALLLVRVPAGTIGVRQRNLGGLGIEPVDHPPGLVLSPRWLETWHFVDARTQTFSLAWEHERPDRPMLELRTRDGNLARIGATLSWRVVRGEAHRMVAEGARAAHAERVRSISEGVLFEALSQLSSDELADTEARAARTLAARDELARRLASVHVEPLAVLVTQVLFGTDYEKKLQQKQNLAQTKLLQLSATAVEREEARVALLEAEIERSLEEIGAELGARIERRRAEGRNLVSSRAAAAKARAAARRAEAQAAHDRELLAGERALARARRLKTELENESWDSPGGRLLLARRAAENLNIKQVTLDSSDPRVPSVLDLDDLVRRLVGGAGGGD